MASDRQTLLAKANASAKHNLMSVGGCADAPVDVDTAGNADGKRPCLGNGKTVLMTTSTQADFVECRREVIIRNGLVSRGYYQEWPSSSSCCGQGNQENMARLNLPQATWIETFLEGVTDKSTGLPLFSELVWFVYKVSGVMCSPSACEHYWSIEGWITEVVIDESVDEEEEEPEA